MKLLLTLVNLLLVFLFANAIVDAFYTHISSRWISSPPPQIQTIQVPQSPQKALSPAQSYTPINHRDLFKTGPLEAPSSASLKKPNPPPETITKITELKLVLKGTVTGNGTPPMAIIKSPKAKKAKPYLEGDAVDKAQIRTILRGKVILWVNGHQEILVMKQPESRTTGLTIPSPPPIPMAQTPSVEDNFTQEVNLTWNQINTLKSQLPELKKQVRVRPHYSKGKMDGFRVTNLKKDSVFFKTLKLRNGDVIASVNDQELKTRSDVKTIYNTFSQTDGTFSADIGVKRSGKTGNIRYSIK